MVRLAVGAIIFILLAGCASTHERKPAQPLIAIEGWMTVGLGLDEPGFQFSPSTRDRDGFHAVDGPLVLLPGNRTHPGWGFFHGSGSCDGFRIESIGSFHQPDTIEQAKLRAIHPKLLANLASIAQGRATLYASSVLLYQLPERISSWDMSILNLTRAVHTEFSSGEEFLAILSSPGPPSSQGFNISGPTWQRVLSGPYDETRLISNVMKGGSVGANFTRGDVAPTLAPISISIIGPSGHVIKTATIPTGSQVTASVVEAPVSVSGTYAVQVSTQLGHGLMNVTTWSYYRNLTISAGWFKTVNPDDKYLVPSLLRTEPNEKSCPPVAFGHE